MTKLVPYQVLEIKRRLWIGEDHSAIAYEHNVCPENIIAIREGKSWIHTPWPDGSLGKMSRDHRLYLRYIKYHQLQQ